MLVCIFYLLWNFAEKFLVILIQNLTTFTIFFIQIVAMETCRAGPERNCMGASESELNEISDQKVDFDHSDSDTTDRNAAEHNASSVGQTGRGINDDQEVWRLDRKDDNFLPIQCLIEDWVLGSLQIPKKNHFKQDDRSLSIVIL